MSIIILLIKVWLGIELVAGIGVLLYSAIMYMTGKENTFLTDKD